LHGPFTAPLNPPYRRRQRARREAFLRPLDRNSQLNNLGLFRMLFDWVWSAPTVLHTPHTVTRTYLPTLYVGRYIGNWYFFKFSLGSSGNCNLQEQFGATMEKGKKLGGIKCEIKLPEC
jgi:hypothetical protein